jgi:hypothetical protein
MAEQLSRKCQTTYGWSGNGWARRDRWNPIRTSAIQSRSRPMRYLCFLNHEKGAPPVPLSSWSLQQTVCSTFSRSGWSVLRSASLAERGTSKKRPSPHLHKVPTRSNKVSPRPFQRPSRLTTGVNMIKRNGAKCSSLTHLSLVPYLAKPGKKSLAQPARNVFGYSSASAGRQKMDVSIWDEDGVTYFVPVLN